MPESKTIEIDEIVSPGESTQKGRSREADTPRAEDTTRSGQAGYGSADPFADFHKALPWKARLTIRMTQWFVLLRGKSWGKFLVVPIVILAVLLAIPLALLAVFVLITRAIFFPRRHQNGR